MKGPALLIVVALAVFGAVLFGGKTMYPTDITSNLILPFSSGRPALDVQETSISDYVLYYYPVRYFQAASFRSGHLNLWNPYIFGGQPAFANNASIVAFDPFNLLLLWPNLGSALGWRSFLQVVACLLIMYAYLRHLELDVASCLVGSIGYGLNSMFWANIFDWSIGGMLWLPVVCLLVDRALAVPSLRRAGQAGLVLGVALLASPLQIYFYLCFSVSALVGLQWLVLRRDRRSLQVASVVGVAVFAIGVGISATQMLPSIELYAQSARFADGPLHATLKSGRSLRDTAVATMALASFVFPNLAGRLKDSMMVSGALWGGEVHWQGFIGIAPFFLAVLGAVASLDRRRIPYVILAVSVVVIILYTPLGPVLYERFFLVYIFCASVLAAFGCSAAFRGALSEARSRLAVRTIGGFLTAIFLALGAVNIALATAGDRITRYVDAKVSATMATNYFGRSYPSLYAQKAHQFLDDLRLYSPHTAVPLLIAVLALLAIAMRARNRSSARAFAGIVVALTALDLVFMTLTHVPMVDAAKYPFSPPSAAIDLIKRDAGPYRVISFRSKLGPPVLPLGLASTYGIQAADGNDDLGPPNLFRLVDFPEQPCGGEICVEPRNTDLVSARYLLTDRLTRLPSLGYDLAYDHEIRVYRSRATFERAFWMTSYRVVPGTSAAIALTKVPGFDPRATVVLDREPFLRSAPTAGAATVSVVDHQATIVTIHVEAETNGLVVLSDTYYPGWRAFLDGRDVPILRANGVMRAVAVESGSHTLEFRYAPNSLRVGTVVSVASLCLALSVSLIAWKPGT